MLRELRFQVVKLISRLLASSYRIIDPRRSQLPGQRTVIPARSHVLDRSRFTMVGDEPFWMRLGTLNLDASYEAELYNAEIIGKGIVVDREGAVVLESTIFQQQYLRRCYQNHLIAFRRFLPSTRHAHALSLINYLDRNYFHWMMESIGRLMLVRERLNAPTLTLLIDADAPRFVRTSISFLFDVPQERILNDGSRRRQVDKLLLPSFLHTRNENTGWANIYPPEMIRWINRTALDKIGPAGPKRNFIITRRNAHQRRMLNAQAMIARFPEKNFTVIEPEELLFHEQVKLFADAGIIIAMHGAGLTNLLFARDARVIEFYPQVREEKDSSYFFQISSTLGMRHTLIGYHPSDEQQNITIGPNELDLVATAIA
jgi:hypothetical protein